jgi:chloramphenicol 3-O phosphotransferase
VILLNGTSSSGKSTLVRALQDRLDGPWLEVGIDQFVFALPRRYRDQPHWSELFRYLPIPGGADGAFTIETGPLGERLVAGMHRTADALARADLDVIVDHVLLEPAWLDDLRGLLADVPVLFVGVRCPLEVVVERERNRRDRTIGQAEAMFHVVHRRGGYDLEVDTSVLGPGECAEAVALAVERGMPDAPFSRVT